MILWACTWESSQARVTSKKSFSSRSSRKATLMLDSKSFHLRHNFSEVILAPWLHFTWQLITLENSLTFWQCTISEKAQGGQKWGKGTKKKGKAWSARDCAGLIKTYQVLIQDRQKVDQEWRDWPTPHIVIFFTLTHLEAWNDLYICIHTTFVTGLVHERLHNVHNI